MYYHLPKLQSCLCSFSKINQTEKYWIEPRTCPCGTPNNITTQEIYGKLILRLSFWKFNPCESLSMEWIYFQESHFGTKLLNGNLSET